MSTVGTVVRFPGIIPLIVPTSGVPPVIPAANLILRGQLVGMAAGVAIVMAAAIVAATNPLYGIAVSDADPDNATVSVATGKGIATVSVMPAPGLTFTAGQILYQAPTPNFQMVTNVAPGTPVILGYCVTPGKDALGNIELAFFAV